MFLDGWQPVSRDTVHDEAQQWESILVSHIPVPELVHLICHEYEALCPSRFKTEHHSVKIIDSIPNTTRTFSADVTSLEAVLNHIMDDSFLSDNEESHNKNDGVAAKVNGLRRYLAHVRSTQGAGDTADANHLHLESVVLPSTTQTGLECIIITLCRVVATWMEPHFIPIEDCLPLCEDKAGRRSIVQLLVHAASGADVLEAKENVGVEETPMNTPSLPDQPSTPAALTGGDEDSQATESDAEETWYSVYDQPTITVLSKSQDFQARRILFNNQEGYRVYVGCKWIHRLRDEEFYPEQTILSWNGRLGSQYVCPVRHIVEGRWYFLTLGAPGYKLFPAYGRHTKKGRVFLQDAGPNTGWTPPDTTIEAREAFLDSLDDPTWRGSTVRSMSDNSDPHTPLSNGSTPRRSKRTRKPLRRFGSDVSLSIEV